MADFTGDLDFVNGFCDGTNIVPGDKPKEVVQCPCVTSGTIFIFDDSSDDANVSFEKADTAGITTDFDAGSKCDKSEDGTIEVSDARSLDGVSVSDKYEYWVTSHNVGNGYSCGSGTSFGTDETTRSLISESWIDLSKDEKQACDAVLLEYASCQPQH